VEWTISLSLLTVATNLAELASLLFLTWLMFPTAKLMWYMKKNHLEFDAKSYLELITKRTK
jgi:hypothetical protein